MRSRPIAAVLCAASLVACEGPRRAALDEPVPVDPRVVRDRMGEHFEVADQLHRAIIDGRLADAREKAGWLVTRDTHWEEQGTHCEEPYAAADTILRAPNLLVAAGGMGRLGRACGHCHEQRGVVFPPTLAAAPPPDAPGLSAQMARHGWAANRLWDGLVMPSDEVWREGASTMSSSTIDLARTTNAKPNEEVVSLAENLQRLSSAGSAEADQELRATIYGEMLVTCARCHSIVRARPVPRRD